MAGGGISGKAQAAGAIVFLQTIILVIGNLGGGYGEGLHGGFFPGVFGYQVVDFFSSVEFFVCTIVGWFSMVLVVG